MKSLKHLLKGLRVVGEAIARQASQMIAKMTFTRKKAPSKQVFSRLPFVILKLVIVIVMYTNANNNSNSIKKSILVLKQK